MSYLAYLTLSADVKALSYDSLVVSFEHALLSGCNIKCNDLSSATKTSSFNALEVTVGYGQWPAEIPAIV